MVLDTAYIYINFVEYIFIGGPLYMNDMTFVFGYGSLINMATNVGELENPLSKPVWPVTVAGLQRRLDVLTPSSNSLVFGVYQREEEEATTNGILFQVNKHELQKLKLRERLYTVKTLDTKRIINTYGVVLPPIKKLLCFFPIKKYVVNHTLNFRILPGYLKLCLYGCKRFGKQFVQDFIQGLNLSSNKKASTTQKKYKNRIYSTRRHHHKI